MSKTVYKVVSEEKRRLFSVVAGGCERVRYIPRRWVQPAFTSLKLGYGLFCFETQAEAFYFARAFSHDQIWEAKVEGVYDKLPNYRSACSKTWKEFIQKGDQYWQECPLRTVMVKRVKLVRRIK